MTTVRRKTIPLQRDEDRLLRKFYLYARVPVDQYEKRPPGEFEAFVKNWNRATGRSDSEDDIKHYMMTKRKNGDWPRMDGKHKTAPSIHNMIELQEDDWDALYRIYLDVVVPKDLGRDSLVYDDELAELVAYKFSQATGRIIPSHLLVAAIMAKSKRKDWAHLPDAIERSRKREFDDLDALEKKKSKRRKASG